MCLLQYTLGEKDRTCSINRKKGTHAPSCGVDDQLWIPTGSRGQVFDGAGTPPWVKNLTYIASLYVAGLSVTTSTRGEMESKTCHGLLEAFMAQ